MDKKGALMRAKNMQKLTDELKLRHPGVVIYGIGDDAHKTRVSDHNEDDTPGVRAEQSDADNNPEHRAIDVMLGPHFNRGDAMDLISDLTLPANRSRLQYIIFDGSEYKRVNNYVKEPYDGSDQHEGHVHVSGRAANDDDTTPWLPTTSGGPRPIPTPPSTNDDLVVDGELGPKTIAKWQKVMKTPVDGKISEDSMLVRKVQQRLHDTVDHRLVVDGDGNSLDTGVFRHTVAALQRYLKSPVDGVISTPKSEVVKALQRRLNEDRF